MATVKDLNDDSHACLSQYCFAETRPAPSFVNGGRGGGRSAHTLIRQCRSINNYHHRQAAL